MPWVKLDDQFFAHPKVVEVSNEAKLLYLAGLTYCAGQLTDGRIGRGALRAVAASLGLDPALAVELVGVGLWSATEAGYAVHDYLEYQPSAEQVRAQRAENARRQAEWRGRRRATRADERNAVTNGVSNAPRNAPVTPTPYPSPSPREVNSPPNGEEQTLVRARPGRASARATPLEGFEDWWGCYPRKIGKGKVFCKLKQKREGDKSGGDGLTVDTKGNLYITSNLGLQVFNPSGDLLGIITLPEQPANVDFGGPDMKTLYVTARSSLYTVPMEATGHVFAQPRK